MPGGVPPLTRLIRQRKVIPQPVFPAQGGVASATERLIVVTNWFEELRERMSSN